MEQQKIRWSHFVLRLGVQKSVEIIPIISMDVVLAAAVNLDFLACVALNGTSVVHFQSEGWPMTSVDLADLEVKEEEKETTASLIRGVLAKLHKAGYPVAGFDMYVTSTVLPGSGPSSSAACEVLIGTTGNHLFCQDRFDAVEIAKIGQAAENEYFGKPCGLMDQTASSVGDAVAIDFKDPANPIVRFSQCRSYRTGTCTLYHRLWCRSCSTYQ